MAFEGLSDKLSNAFKKLRGKGRLTEQDVKDAIRANQAELLCTQRAIITPAAADRSAATGLQIRRV